VIEAEIKKSESLPPYESGSKYQVNPTEETLLSLGEHLRIRYTKIKNFTERSQWEKDKAKAFEAYHMVPKKRPLPFPGAANLSSPLPRIGVDSFHANVMSSAFVNGTKMLVQPDIVQKDFANSSRKAANYMTYVMNHEADFYNVLDDADKKAQMYGIGYLEPRYLIDEAYDTIETTEIVTDVSIDPQTGNLVKADKKVTKTEKKKKKVFDGIKIDSIPVESIRLSPFFKTIEQAVKEDVVFKDFRISLAEIKSRTKKRGDKPGLYLKDQVDKIIPGMVAKATKNLSALDQAKAEKDGFFRDLATDPELVDLVEAYLWWDVDGDDIKEEIKCVVDVQSGTVLRTSLSKCRIVEIVPRPVDDRFYGDGIPKISENLDEEWENYHNTRSNAGQWENTTFGFYRAGGRFNASSITIMPGKFYPVDDPREVQFAQPPRVGQSYFQEEQMIMNYFQRIFALDENMQGVASSRRTTATESINISNRGSIRFANPFNRIINQLNKLVNHCWELNMECAPEEKEYYVVGTDGAPAFDKMARYDFTNPMKFSISVSSVFDQQMIRDTMLLAYRLFLVNPYVQQHPETLWELSQNTLDTLKVDVKLPKPSQAQSLSPYEEHEMFKRGEDVEPVVGEDYDHHLKVHEMEIKSEDLENWDDDAIKKLILHRDKTMILKQTLESSNLNKSGMPDLGAMNPMMKQPGLTINRNPTQKFNTTKVGESGKSMVQNNQNGGMGAEQAMAQITGQQI
jgi:hypothetical protein